MPSSQRWRSWEGRSSSFSDVENPVKGVPGRAEVGGDGQLKSTGGVTFTSEGPVIEDVTEELDGEAGAAAGAAAAS